MSMFANLWKPEHEDPALLEKFDVKQVGTDEVPKWEIKCKECEMGVHAGTPTPSHYLKTHVCLPR